MKKQKVNWNDVLARVLKTFIQAFFGAAAGVSLLGVQNLADLKTALIGIVSAGAAAGLCAVWNTAKEFIDKELKKQ